MSIYVTDESEVSRARVECDILWRTTTRQAARYGSLGWERGVGGGNVCEARPRILHV